jgi:hypothetical protein
MSIREGQGGMGTWMGHEWWQGRCQWEYERDREVWGHGWGMSGGREGCQWEYERDREVWGHGWDISG